MVGLLRFHVLFVIDIASRKVEIAGITASPSGTWIQPAATFVYGRPHSGRSVPPAGRVSGSLIRLSPKEQQRPRCSRPLPTHTGTSGSLHVVPPLRGCGTSTRGGRREAF